MRASAVGLALSLLVALAGCGGGGNNVPPPPEAAAAAAAPTVLDPMTRQLEKAQERADALPKERKDALDQAIEGPPQ